MNAKILLLALLLTVTHLSAQTPAPAPTTAAPIPDWSATTNARPANAPTNGRPAITRPQRPATLPGFPAAATPAPAAEATPATPTVVPVQPGASPTPDLTAMVIRPPATASSISEPDRMMEAGSINWTAASLENVLEIYSKFVGRNLLRPATLPKAEIVLQQTTPLTKLEVVRMIEAALYLNQISVVNVGDKFVTVVLNTEAYKIPGVLNTNDFGSYPPLGSMATHVVQLKYTKPSEMVTVLTPFASGTAANPIMPLDSSGILVLRDNVANVKRMLEMIERVDVVAQSEIISEVIPIKYAKAEEIASALSSVGGGTGGTVGTRTSATSRSATSSSANRLGGVGGYNPNQPGGMPGGTTPTPTPSSSATFGDRVRNLITKAAGSGDFTILGETKIIADIRSNSLLVFASRQDMDMIKDIISKLDVVLAQVLIETVIMDVSLGDDLTFGVTAGQPPKTKGDITAGGFYNNSGQLGTLNNFFNQTVTNGIFPTGSGLNYFGRFGGDLDVAVAALASDSRVNVIQKPRIQTSHATPASLFVGETVPYISSTYYGGGYGGGPSSSYQQLRVGIQLSVTPFINQDGLVVMTIEETIDEISGNVIIDNNPVPATTSRTLSAEVAVRDRESIILGGFIRNSDNKAKSGVPLLKDIPLLGALFRSSTSAKARKELIVLMRPTVLRTPELAALQVNVEKQRLPGVREAEAQLDKVELNRAQQDLKKGRRSTAAPQPAPQPNFNQVTPFTPEEEKLLYTPPASATP
jgi:type II secretory pathway component GspD/PulD (secretin)